MVSLPPRECEPKAKAIMRSDFHFPSIESESNQSDFYLAQNWYRVRYRYRLLNWFYILDPNRDIEWHWILLDYSIGDPLLRPTIALNITDKLLNKCRNWLLVEWISSGTKYMTVWTEYKLKSAMIVTIDQWVRIESDHKRHNLHNYHNCRRVTTSVPNPLNKSRRQRPIQSECRRHYHYYHYISAAKSFSQSKVGFDSDSEWLSLCLDFELLETPSYWSSSNVWPLSTSVSITCS